MKKVRKTPPSKKVSIRKLPLLTDKIFERMIEEVEGYAILILDEEGIISSWNKGAEKIKGYTAKEIIGKNFRIFYSRDDRDALLPDRLLEEARNVGFVHHEGLRVRKDGSRFWGSVTITAIHDEEKQVIGFSKVTRDLTEAKRAEDQVRKLTENLRNSLEDLRQSEERYHKMISEVQDYAIIFLDVDGNIQNWNVGAEFIKGYLPSEIIGKNFKVFYTQKDRDERLPETLLERARVSGKAVHEGWRIRKDGTRFWGSVVITSLHSDMGALIGFTKVTRDLTTRKEHEEELKRRADEMVAKNEELERVNAELSSFAYVSSHDLKEPLRKIQIFLARIEEVEKLSERGIDYIRRVNGSAERMQRLIDDLLAYSALSKDTQPLERVDLNDVVQNVKSDLEIAIADKNAIVEAEHLPQVAGVPFQFHQLFLNLLSNSLKFSRVGVQPRIKIQSRTVKGRDVNLPSSQTYHEITLSDNGMGFDPQYSSRIFEIFQRLHTKNAAPGTGIGLAIVKRIVENHRGFVKAVGTPDKGATFHIYLSAPELNQFPS